MAAHVCAIPVRADAAAPDGGRFPRRVEHEYADALLERVALLEASTLRALSIRPGDLGDVRADAGARRALRVIERLAELWRARPFSLEEVAGYAADVGAHAERVLRRVVAVPLPRVVTVSGENLAAQWARENVELISTIDARYFDEIADLVLEATRAGLPTARLADEIRARTGVAESRARLIARDQVGTLNGLITREQHLALGFESYTWLDSRDRRVRPEHRARHGRVFLWSEPPEDGPPGVPIACRCAAVPHR